MINSHTTQIRVRYSETDAMGFLHHSNYLCYFEIGRTELFRAQGGSYRRMEELGLYFVVAKIDVRFRRPARYDDLLTLKTEISSVSLLRSWNITTV
jgi:acyl-CoA thioester hydrolase